MKISFIKFEVFIWFSFFFIGLNNCKKDIFVFIII